MSALLTTFLKRQNRDITFIMFSQRRYYDVTFTTLDSKVTSEYIMNIVIAKSKQRWNDDVEFNTFFQCRYYDGAPRLRQLCETHRMSFIHSRMIIFPQLCAKVIKKISNDMIFVWYNESILWHQIQAIIFLLCLSSAKLEFCSLKLCKKKGLDLDFLSISKAITFQRMWCNILLS